MEEKQLTEKESLELISQMIQSTKDNMKVGSGNQFLYWGYFTSILSLFIFGTVYATLNGLWHWCWMLMFIFWFLMTLKKDKPGVMTFIDKAISRVWAIIGCLFIITAVGCILFFMINHTSSMLLMMPLSIIYASIGVSITGILIKERWATCLPLISFAIGFYMLCELSTGGTPTLIWDLLLGLSFFVMMVIPGHVLNHKEKKQC